MNAVVSNPLRESSQSSCKNCRRFTELEGALLCYREGSITPLEPKKLELFKPGAACEAWQANKQAR
ncbi:hypothetical protein L2725_07390 [Shewanella corallii]|uniref:Uncharacterized protein n=2 Tax=Shewanella TaxID=22 RepID=A0ABT0N707_9GAMM|nr:hypothetical protein [Shewanella corallii]MCL2913612.1 hypothetical protein [Shewanella corallii]